MSDFSGLPRAVLAILRLMCWGIVILLVMIILVLLWLRHVANGFAFPPGEGESLIVMAVLAGLSAGIAGLMGRELRRMR